MAHGIIYCGEGWVFFHTELCQLDVHALLFRVLKMDLSAKKFAINSEVSMKRLVDSRSTGEVSPPYGQLKPQCFTAGFSISGCLDLVEWCISVFLLKHKFHLES